MRNSIFETILGAVVIFVAGAFMYFSLSQTGFSGASGNDYQLIAKFNNVAGIERGSDVLMAGVKVGSVTDVAYLPEEDAARLTLSVRGDVQLSYDSNARIVSGLFGGASLNISQGSDFGVFDDYLETDGTGEITDTQGAVDLLTLASQLMGGGGGN